MFITTKKFLFYHMSDFWWNKINDKYCNKNNNDYCRNLPVLKHTESRLQPVPNSSSTDDTEYRRHTNIPVKDVQCIPYKRGNNLGQYWIGNFLEPVGSGWLNRFNGAYPDMFHLFGIELGKKPHGMKPQSKYAGQGPKSYGNNKNHGHDKFRHGTKKCCYQSCRIIDDFNFGDIFWWH